MEVIHVSVNMATDMGMDTVTDTDMDMDTVTDMETKKNVD
jgi:hypothetical protein